MEACDHLFKVILVGDSGVGKTSLLKRICWNSFCPVVPATIGVDMSTLTMKVGDERVKLSLWDTAGQEKYQAITNQYYRGANGVLFVFDVTERTTFENIRNRWLPEFRGSATHSDVVTIIIGNKSDEVAERAVGNEEAAELARELDCLYFETSAKTNDGIFECLTWGLISTLLEQTRERAVAGGQDNVSTINPAWSHGQPARQKQSCCRW